MYIIHNNNRALLMLKWIIYFSQLVQDKWKQNYFAIVFIQNGIALGT